MGKRRWPFAILLQLSYQNFSGKLSTLYCSQKQLGFFWVCDKYKDKKKPESGKGTKLKKKSFFLFELKLLAELESPFGAP